MSAPAGQPTLADISRSFQQAGEQVAETMRKHYGPLFAALAAVSEARQTVVLAAEHEYRQVRQRENGRNFRRTVRMTGRKI